LKGKWPEITQCGGAATKESALSGESLQKPFQNFKSFNVINKKGHGSCQMNWYSCYGISSYKKSLVSEA
jgi:hypothetical protein